MAINVHRNLDREDASDGRVTNSVSVNVGIGVGRKINASTGDEDGGGAMKKYVGCGVVGNGSTEPMLSSTGAGAGTCPRQCPSTCVLKKVTQHSSCDANVSILPGTGDVLMHTPVSHVVYFGYHNTELKESSELPVAFAVGDGVGNGVALANPGISSISCTSIKKFAFLSSSTTDIFPAE